MKTFNRLFAILFVMLMVQFSFGQITGSAHDFRAASWMPGQPTGEVCIVCHTPHNAQAPTVGPLWNHLVTTQTFVPYNDGGESATMNATPGQPSGISKLCLSCHDGATQLDDFGTNTGTVTMGVVPGNFGLGLDNDHPISFSYTDALATTDGTLHPPTSTTSGLGLNIDDDMLFGGSNDQLECASCHDVHNKGNLGKMLRKANTQSALCFTCHNK